jgi:hypothetical protein
MAFITIFRRLKTAWRLLTWRRSIVAVLLLGCVTVLLGWAVYTHLALRRVKEELRKAQSDQCRRDLPLQLLEARLNALQKQPAAVWESYALHGPDHQLGFPVLYGPQSRPPCRYEPKRQGLKVRYTGNHFQAGMHKNILYQQINSRPGDSPVLSVLVGGELQPGEQLTLLDDRFYDFAVGVLFVKVQRDRDGHEGYLEYATLIGETIPAEDHTASRRLPFGESYLYLPLPLSIAELEDLASDMEKGLFLGKGKDFRPDQVNPVSVGCRVMSGLLGTLSPAVPAALRKKLIAGGERFFQEYGFPQAKTLANGAVAWPNPSAWPMDWKLTLAPPWYSGYGNAVMALSAAILYQDTGKEAYRDLALKAVRFLQTPTRDGGALYYVGHFPHLAEYVYPSPPLPNVRVLDGEMIAVICVHDIAVLLRDSALLNLSMRLVASLSTDLDGATTHDGKILNARYPWLVDNVNYLNGMKVWAIMLGEIGKDLRFLEFAQRWNLSTNTWR